MILKKEFEYNTDEELACYKLANMTGVGNKSIFSLLKCTGSAIEVLKLPEQSIYEILNKRSANAFLQQKDKVQELTLEKLKNKENLKFIPYLSPEYPNRLRNIANPPFSLYVKGQLPKEHIPSVAIIGARACSEYGKNVASLFGKRLGAAGIQVISGMARGIDGIAQRGAIEGGGQTYAVLGCGADVCYPPENISLYKDIPQCGGIISEYPNGTKAQSGLFPERNRIISGLADLLLVIEARKRSGTYITVTQALEQGKDVYVVPGRITDSLSEGCNFLLTQGAGVATCPEMIIDAVGGCGDSFKRCGTSGLECKLPYNENNQNTGDGMQNNGMDKMEKIILSYLDTTPISMEELFICIQDVISTDLASLQLELIKLQIKGYVVGVGNYYCRRSTL